MIPEYNYQCIDRSIITPPFKKFIVSPLFRFIPWGVPANLITIISNIFLYTSLYLAASKGTAASNYIIIPFLIFLYAIGDHFDGMQAKRTKTSSGLGEFCDHYLDVFNNGILLYILITLYKVENPFVIAFLYLTAYIPHAAVIYEEYKTKWLVFEAIGSLEGIFFIIILTLLGASDMVFNFFQKETVYNLSLIELVMLLSTVGTMGTLVKIYLRIKKFSPGFFIYVICSLYIFYFCFNYTSLLFTFLFFTFYNGDYLGKLMRGHLADGRERYPDLIMPAVLLIFYLSDIILKRPPAEAELLFVFAYLAVRVFWTTASVVFTLRKNIVLWNPEL
jgi:ethanolaminephosphotransferase